jgi:threonine/homoserine/homoserine lactone efflux protein
VGDLIVIGVIVGFAVTLPTGPVNLMVISRTLRRGFAPGFVAGLGSVAADGLFALAAVFGVKAVEEFLAGRLWELQLAGGAALVLFGIAVAVHRVRPADDDAPRGLKRGFAAGFAMTIANPGGFFAFLAIFSGLRDVVAVPVSAGRGLVLTLAVMAGATLWWLALTAAVRALAGRLGPRFVVWLNRVSGIALALAGLVLLARALAIGG